MKTQNNDKAEKRTRWHVRKVPAGETTILIGAARAGVGATVNLTDEQAEQLNKRLPGCVEFAGV